MSLLDVDDVTVRFGGIVALDGLSFSIEEGHICGLIGPNGAGKTTMFNVVSRIYQPTSGSVRFRGQELLEVPAHGIAKLGIARALVHEPEVLVLDEPTRSLDPIAASEVCEILSDLANAGHTVVLSSHRLDELERLAHDVSVIIGGQLRYSGSMEALRTEGSTVASALEDMLMEDRRRIAREQGLDL